MRALIPSILILLVSGFSFSVSAQVTAVMQAKVNIISGAGFNSMEESHIDLSSYNHLEDLEAGAFSLVSAPGADISIHISDQSSIKNEKGESIEFELLKVNQKSSKSGDHRISINGKIKNHQNLNGQYKGNITAVVEYL